MILIAHIFVALVSLAAATLAFITPTQIKINLSYGFATATLLSGTLLIIQNQVSILRTCLMGILFFGAISALTTLARRKLATQSIRIKK